MRRQGARAILWQQPLTATAIHRTMRSLFPRRNDFGSASFEELVPELSRLGIDTIGQFSRLMKNHRRALREIELSRMDQWHVKFYEREFGEEQVRDCLRRQYWFAYPGLVRIAAELQFGEEQAAAAQVPEA